MASLGEGWEAFACHQSVGKQRSGWGCTEQGGDMASMMKWTPLEGALWGTGGRGKEKNLGGQEAEGSLDSEHALGVSEWSVVSPHRMYPPQPGTPLGL